MSFVIMMFIYGLCSIGSFIYTDVKDALLYMLAFNQMAILYSVEQVKKKCK